MNYEEFLKFWLEESQGFNKFTDIQRLSSGISSNVCRIGNASGDTLILKYAISDDFVTKKRIFNQYQIQKTLYGSFPVAEPLYYNISPSIFEFPFYIMEDIEGRPSYNSESIINSFDMLHKLHSTDLDKFLTSKTKGKNNIGYNIQKINKQCIDRSELVPINVDHIYKWLMKNYPEENKNSIVHNDWKMDNILFHNNQISAILDWELFDVGDPRMDFGIAMSYWSDEYLCPKERVLDLFIDKYFVSDKEWEFFELLGMFRLIPIAQLAQIRYNDMTIQDKINTIVERCEGAIR